MRWIAVIAASTALIAGCTHNGIQGTPIPNPASSPSTSADTSKASTTKTTVPDRVKGTTFDACTAITDADVATWEVKPGSRDAHTTAFGQNVRGCIWDGPKWGVKVYAVDGSVSGFERLNDRWDRQEQVTIGTRTGWLLHDREGMSCTIVVPSQQAIAAVQVDLNLDLTRQHYDQCPLALQIMTQIEPKIP
ncbi:DUF3558 family protein [Mycobacteroides franklinii]|uniref:DUF3558 domain-containing protein n=1 Tax=Mycobacteroides franklinii TaxID=948102 RepID=A0A4R5P7Y0_9MYCO|nr:DUF3558 family protein [Mycobacteroides franklinii]ORA61645.1 hypothetical protein BST24_09275 [Mycobacteroides franklinii]TDH19191.1 DUF3558 domain-containing protein [Mycobacteroides franklinii]